MTADLVDEVFRRLQHEGFQEIALEFASENVEQIRFSASTTDLHNYWDEENLSVFASKNGRTVSTVIKDPASVDQAVARLNEVASRTPENNSFVSINRDHQAYGNGMTSHFQSVDLQDLQDAMVNGSLAAGADRAAGLIYNRNSEITVKTSYNECHFSTGGLEGVIRAFRGTFTGQEALHFGFRTSPTARSFEEMGAEAASTASAASKMSEINPGKFRVILSPYVMGNILSYGSGFLSYYAVETGLSCFAGMLGQEVSSEEFNLYDDPTDYSGVGSRICDDEGTPTSRLQIIGHGKLQSYLHSTSTASRAGARTTGNAGIISPRAWQLSLEAGKTHFENMLENLDSGLLINNAWYTRFQDYRNGVFSTVPRDGVFLVRDGEIQGTVSGIRISDSVPGILRNVSAISRERKRVKWWEEIYASTMPYVMVDGVNISKAF
ncbi:MAG: TldD/PmbA family protein [Thermoplasmataceae archaeon]